MRQRPHRRPPPPPRRSLRATCGSSRRSGNVRCCECGPCQAANSGSACCVGDTVTCPVASRESDVLVRAGQARLQALQLRPGSGRRRRPQSAGAVRPQSALASASAAPPSARCRPQGVCQAPPEAHVDSGKPGHLTAQVAKPARAPAQDSTKSCKGQNLDVAKLSCSGGGMSACTAGRNWRQLKCGTFRSRPHSACNGRHLAIVNLPTFSGLSAETRARVPMSGVSPRSAERG